VVEKNKKLKIFWAVEVRGVTPSPAQRGRRKAIGLTGRGLKNDGKSLIFIILNTPFLTFPRLRGRRGQQAAVFSLLNIPLFCNALHYYH
jgi:hypothetical protein